MIHNIQCFDNLPVVKPYTDKFKFQTYNVVVYIQMCIQYTCTGEFFLEDSHMTYNVMKVYNVYGIIVEWRGEGKD
jgi:hypothetical protein